MLTSEIRSLVIKYFCNAKSITVAVFFTLALIFVNVLRVYAPSSYFYYTILAKKRKKESFDLK